MKKILILLALCIGIASCKKASTPYLDTVNANNTSLGSYQYKVICSQGTFTVTYINDNNTWTTLYNVPSGWTYTGHPKLKEALQIATFPTAENAGIKLTLSIYYNNIQKALSIYTTVLDSDNKGFTYYQIP